MILQILRKTLFKSWGDCLSYERLFFQGEKTIFQQYKMNRYDVNIIQIESMNILGKYKMVKKIGKESYGDIILAEDENGQRVTIKFVSLNILKNDPFMFEYVEGEKQCMADIKSDHVLKLQDFQEDQNYYYFIMEGYSGMDLLHYQAKQPSKVFNLKNATQVLSQVIKGIKDLHHANYVHRDIKSQSIILKNEDPLVLKIANMSFSKKTEDIGGTVLGTQHYMSPQIFKNEMYGFEVDIWALGVLFYFMLNQQFPFKLNPHSNIQKKQQDLYKISMNFSYKSHVQKSKKRIMENCTPQIQDLFAQIFTPDQAKRITIDQICKHKVFSQYFQNQSIQHDIKPKLKMRQEDQPFMRIMEVKKRQAPTEIQSVEKKRQRKKNTKKHQFILAGVKIQQNNNQSLQLKRAKTSQQITYLEMEMNKINFLYQLQKQLKDHTYLFLTVPQIISLRYNLLKYNYILLGQFLHKLTPFKLELIQPNLKWNEFTKKIEFQQFKKDINETMNALSSELNEILEQCTVKMDQILLIDPKFKQNCERNIKNEQFSGDFKQSYRSSTGRAFMKARQKISQLAIHQRNYYPYMATVLILCHIFNWIINSGPEKIDQIFTKFVQSNNLKGKQLDYQSLKAWISQQSKDQLKKIIKSALKCIGE